MPQPIIDGFEFARLGREQHGDWPVADLPRLQAVVRSNAGSVAWSVKGVRDGMGRLALAVEVQGTLALSCQRCLETLEHRFRSASVLVLAHSEAEADADPVEVEGPERIVAGPEMPVRDLVEDEVLLALPLAARHERCSGAQDEGRAKTNKPFAGLKGLLGGH